MHNLAFCYEYLVIGGFFSMLILMDLNTAME